MRYHILFYSYILLLVTACKTSPSIGELSERYPIIPSPMNIEKANGTFEFKGDITVELQTSDSLIRRASDFLIDYISSTGLCQLSYQKETKKNDRQIIFSVSDTMQNKEAYQLQITPKTITICSRGGAGAFFAVQTLRQLLPAVAEKKICDKNIALSVPAGTIYDAPRFAYRGLLLDVGRYYFSPEFIKRYIDLMAIYKFNKLHLHITEDQGWRIEIKSHPKLTTVGAWRKQSILGHKKDVPRRYDGIPHGGFYTQEQLKELVSYAANRNIEIIPEIDMPGHTQAVLAAYPQLACFSENYEVSCDWGVHKNVLCTKEDSFLFLEDVLNEVFDVFPSKYIHIGGDECPKDRWKKCRVCQQNIKRLGLKDEHELQSYFIRRIEQYANHHGKKIIGWDEILEGGLASNAIVMSWRGEDGGIKAAEMSHQVIMTPRQYCYLDYYQGNPENEPLAISGYTPLDSVYQYNPTGRLKAEQAEYIWGIQGNLWTEYISTPAYAEYMAYPRAIAIAEVAWSPLSHKCYTHFLQRLAIQTRRLDILDVNYAKHFLFQNNQSE